MPRVDLLVGADLLALVVGLLVHVGADFLELETVDIGASRWLRMSPSLACDQGCTQGKVFAKLLQVFPTT